ncbi:MAG: uroporphyrinogen-III synthase [Acidobacteriota bacterium]
MTAKRLAGQRVVVTRAAHQAERLLRELRDRGAEAVPLPLIELTPPPDPHALERAVELLPEIDWLVFTSANAVAALMPRVSGPLETPCAVVGAATARALKGYGVEASLVASVPRATGLLEALLPRLELGAHVLVPQAADARPELVNGLTAAGVAVTAVTAYGKRQPPAAESQARELFTGSTIGWVSFTSPRIARNFASLFGDDWPHRRDEIKALSIGPVTSSALHALGVEAVIEAPRPSDTGLVDALLQAIADPRR